MKSQRNWPRLVITSMIVCLIADLLLSLWAVRSGWFSSMPATSYLWVVLKGLSTGIGAVTSGIAVLWGILKLFLKHKLPRPDQIAQSVARRISMLLHQLRVSLPILTALMIVAPLLIWLSRQKLPFLPPASSVVIAPDGKEVYVADYIVSEKLGMVQVFDARTGKTPYARINFSTGKPEFMAIGPKSGNIYVVDTLGRTLAVIDKKTHEIKRSGIPVGETPHAIAITPDELKAYISNEQPSPQGSISVIDLKTDTLSTKITGVNCPEGLAISRDGKRLYVSSQCGAGQDPVFVIDTQRDKVVAAIPGLAVGGVPVVVTPDGRKIYVGRSSFRTRNPSTGSTVSVPDQLSVIEAGRKEYRIAKSLRLSVACLAVTPDGKYVLAAGGLQVNIISTETDTVKNTIPLEAAPAGIAVATAKDESGYICYVWLPEERHLFFLGLSGLLQTASRW